jgi:hypothetical protein
MDKTNKHYYYPHIILNGCSLLLLLIGIYFAISKPKQWFARHRACMIVSTILFFCSIFYALFIKEYSIKKQGTVSNVSKTASLHSHLGIIIGILLLIQIYIAITHREQLGSAYKIIHRTIAILLVSCIVIQVYLGIKEYRLLNI